MPSRFAKAGMVTLVCVLLLLAPWGAGGVVEERGAKLKELCTVQGELLSTEYANDRSWNFSFANGDWIQESGKSFLPFLSNNASRWQVEQLSSFFLRPSKMYNRKLQGILQLMTTSSYISRSIDPEESESRYFLAYPGLSLLSIAMEGYYVATRTERVLCMLGCTVPRPIFSTLEANVGRNWKAPTQYSWDDEDKAQQDCGYFLQLRYPRTISLATPAIRGKLRSLDSSFADINLSSIAIEPYYANHSDAPKLIAATCNEASVTEFVQEQNVYKDSFFCPILFRAVPEWIGFSVQLNWPCNVSHSFCSRMGPFTDSRDYKSITDAKLFMTNLRCSDRSYDNALGNGSWSYNSQVSVVFRLVGSSEADYIAYEKTGLSNGLALTAEGSWDSKSGVLCMAACRGNDDDLQLQTTTREDCDVRICLYLPMALTLSQRGVVVGNISSTRQYDPNDNSTVPLFFHPLSFFLPLNPQGWGRALHYEYSKISKAVALLDRHEPTSNVRNKISRITSALFRYPSLGNGDRDYRTLAADLLIQTSGYVDGTPSFVQFELIAIEDEILVGGWYAGAFEPTPDDGSRGAGEVSGGQQESHHLDLKELGFLRVAGQLKAGTKANISTEGVYNPKTGKMYMMGCRNLKEDWSTLYMVNDLDRGLDCYVEVVIEYPAASLMWIASQSASITISSSRSNADSIVFDPIKVSTTAITYQNQRQGMVSERSLEGALSIVTLSFMLVCIFGQWRHMDKYPNSTAFISLLMLGIQAVALAIPLITGAESLFANKDTSGPVLTGVHTGLPWEGYAPVLYIGKVLTLIAFLMLAWLFERVWKARSQASTSQEWISVPSEKKVFALWAVFHIVGIVVVIVSHPRSEALEVFSVDSDAAHWVAPTASIKTDMGSGARDWQKEVLEYGGLIQDLFLLPQVFGGFTWKCTGKPLRKLYYVGITVLRLLPHFYDRYRKSHFYPYPTMYAYPNNADYMYPQPNDAGYMYANPSYGFFSRAADIVIPTFSLVLALVVWVQQSCSYAQWARCFSRSAKHKAVSHWATGTELSKRIQRTLSPIPENKPIMARGEDSDD